MHEGDLSALLEKLARERAQAARRSAPQAARVEKPKTKKLSSREQEELATLPARITEAEAELARLDAELLDPKLYTMRGADPHGVSKARDTAVKRVEALYARWVELEAS